MGSFIDEVSTKGFEHSFLELLSAVFPMLERIAIRYDMSKKSMAFFGAVGNEFCFFVAPGFSSVFGEWRDMCVYICWLKSDFFLMDFQGKR